MASNPVMSGCSVKCLRQTSSKSDSTEQSDVVSPSQLSESENVLLGRLEKQRHKLMEFYNGPTGKATVETSEDDITSREDIIEETCHILHETYQQLFDIEACHKLSSELLNDNTEAAAKIESILPRAPDTFVKLYKELQAFTEQVRRQESNESATLQQLEKYRNTNQELQSIVKSKDEEISTLKRDHSAQAENSTKKVKIEDETELTRLHRDPAFQQFMATFLSDFKSGVADEVKKSVGEVVKQTVDETMQAHNEKSHRRLAEMQRHTASIIEKELSTVTREIASVKDNTVTKEDMANMIDKITVERRETQSSIDKVTTRVASLESKLQPLKPEAVQKDATSLKLPPIRNQKATLKPTIGRQQPVTGQTPRNDGQTSRDDGQTPRNDETKSSKFFGKFSPRN